MYWAKIRGSLHINHAWESKEHYMHSFIKSLTCLLDAWSQIHPKLSSVTQAKLSKPKPQNAKLTPPYTRGCKKRRWWDWKQRNYPARTDSKQEKMEGRELLTKGMCRKKMMKKSLMKMIWRKEMRLALEDLTCKVSWVLIWRNLEKRW